mgnify:CR=1 FL=1
MTNWKKKNTKQKLQTLLPFLGVLLLIGVFLYCCVTPSMFWIIKNGTRRFYKKRIIIMSCIVLFGILTCLLNYSKNCRYAKALTWLVFLLTPIVTFLLLEYANPAGPSLIWRSTGFVSVMRSIVTIIILMIVMTTLFTLTNSMRFSGCFLCIFAIVFAIGNYFTTKFRGIPILASDLTIMGTAMNVVGNYEYTLDFCRILMLTGLIVWCVVLFRMPKVQLPKGKKRLKYVLAGIAVFFASSWTLLYTPVLRRPMHITINTFRPIKSYKRNGSILTFLRSIQLMIVKKPDGYSDAAASNIAAPYCDTEDDKENYNTPNVIVIMDEAFSDLQAIGNFETSEDVMPFYHSIKENAVKGFVYVSVFGGQTANTEFEFLTGLSKAYIPESSTPYQLYIKSLLPGLTTFLGKQDYQGLLAFHPFHANGYNRHNVYPNLGFSDFISIEDMTYNDSDLLRGFISDQADFDLIIDEYEKAKTAGNAPFYMFNVTMQNHSGYDKDFDNLDLPISIEKDFDSPELKRYLNLIHHSDAALKSLIEYFEKTDDPTVVVFFGDHEPGLSDDFYSKLLGKNVSSLTNEENMELYKTPFLIWANYDIEEKENVNTSINYLSTMMLEAAGMKMSPFNRFLSDMHNEVPILTSHGYYGNDGVYYSLDDTTSPYYSSLENYHILQYNDLFDKKNRIDGFFD